MINLQDIDYDKATNILYGLGTAVATVIGFILKFRNKAKSEETGDGQTPQDFATTLLAERVVLMKERDKAMATAATAWREREKLTAQVATLQEQNNALKDSLAVTNRRVEMLIRAINRLDPKLLAAFGSDFAPL